MLTDADKQIIARDSALPGLAALLDSELLLNELRNISGLQNAQRADIQYLRYKPRNSCACTLRVKLADGTSKYYFAKALTEARFEQSWNHPKRQKLIRENDPNAPLAIFERYIMLLHPAYDRGIRHLGWLVDEKLRRRVLALCSLPDREKDGSEIDILRYKPERRLVAGVRFGKGFSAVIRCANATDFGNMLIGAAFGAAQGNMRLLGVDGSICTLVTDWQDGHSLCPEEKRCPSAQTVSHLARILSQIHRTAYRHPVRYGTEEEILALQGVLFTFRSILPEDTRWFTRLIKRVKRGLSAQPERFALIHGDFSLDQVVQRRNGTEKELHILDWDRAACGNPLTDLASLQARLELQVIEGILPRRQADGIIDVFLQSYRKEAEYDPDGLAYFVASAMLRLATEPFRKRAAQWPQYTLQLLQRVEEILAVAERRYPDMPVGSVDLSADPMLTTLTDRNEMQAPLINALPSAERGILVGANLRRYKVRRRALIDYEIDTGDERRYIIGKYRSKGADERSFIVQRALWDEGFKDTAVTSVAEPLAVLPDLNLWLQREVNGQCVGDMLTRSSGRLAFLGEAVANALTTLHKSTTAQKLNLPHWTPTQELQVLRERLTQAQSLLPELSARIAALLAGCERLVKRLPDTPLVTVHRDFYQDQILERYGQPGRMTLLDLDLLCQGPAALDAGNYLAHIQEFALRRYADIRALEEHQRAFVNAFSAHSATAGLQDIEAYTTLSLARHIYISTQFQERRHTTETLLAICEERLT